LRVATSSRPARQVHIDRARGPCQKVKNDYYDYSGFLCDEVWAMSAGTWTVAEAKAKFSEVVDKARVSGPQIITKNGRTAVVVVSAEEWERKTRRPGNLAEFFAESPLRGSGLKAPRKKDGPREIDL
jgi:prevent-host-death family protein